MPMPTSLAPGYIRQTYDGVLFPHHMTVPVNPDGTPTPGVEPDLILQDLSTTNVIAAWDAMLDVIMPYFPTTTNFGQAEIHLVDATTGEDTFIFAWNAGRTGSSLVARIATEQIVFSFKTSLGTAYKLYLMESIEEPNQRFLPPYAAPADALSDFIVGASSPVYGRKNAYPFIPVSFITKTNDKLRKQQGLA